MHVEPLIAARGILRLPGIQFRYHCDRSTDLQLANN